MKWTLRNHCKRIYHAACCGDERALADIRAYVDTLRKNRNRNRWLKKLATHQKKKMKKRMNLIAMLAATSLLMLSGCAQLTPEGAAVLTRFAVYEYGKNNKQATDTMRRIQPTACEVALHPDGTLAAVVTTVQNIGGVNADTKELLNVLLAIYQTSVQPHGTNVVKHRPYLQAVFCDGWQGGLEAIPSGPAASVTKRNAAPQFKTWVRVK